MVHSLAMLIETMFIDSVNITYMDAVNMSKAKTPYHHGDLRAKLLKIAISHIEDDGVSKLSLRNIASQAGVSHNAPYMHFPNKDALLDEVIAHGFAQLRARISDAGGKEMLTSSDWGERVKSGFRAYVAFAQEHPNLYALMHIPRNPSNVQKQGKSGKAEADTSGTATLKGLASTLEGGQKLGRVRAGNTNDKAIWVWTTLHGLASLTSEDRMAFEGRSTEAVTEIVLDNLLKALESNHTPNTG